MIFSSSSLKRQQHFDVEDIIKESKRIKDAARYQEAIQGLNLLLHGIDAINQQKKQPLYGSSVALSPIDDHSFHSPSHVIKNPFTSSPIVSENEKSEDEQEKEMEQQKQKQKQIQVEEEKEKKLVTSSQCNVLVTRTRMSVLDLIQETPSTSQVSSPSLEVPDSEEAPSFYDKEEQIVTSSSPITPASMLSSSDIQVTQQQHQQQQNANGISFYYPCAAQKSYGSEKRFLCPPPVVTLNGKKSSTTTPSISIVVNVDNNEMEHKAQPDENNKASFKQIHVSSSSKLFQLKLQVEMEKTCTISLDSPPITIISKPSTKTTKSRNVSLGINSGDMVCLFNRVNSQTVRTKYMGVEKKKFVAKGSSWSPFIIKCATKELGVPITYGMEVLLIDVETGFSSDVMIVRKVVKNTLTENTVGAVTQLQKIALQPKSKPESFLSILPSCAYGIHNTLLCYHQPSPPKGNIVQDYMCWTIVRIEKSECKMEPTTTTSTSSSTTTTDVKLKEKVTKQRTLSLPQNLFPAMTS